MLCPTLVLVHERTPRALLHRDRFFSHVDEAVRRRAALNVDAVCRCRLAVGELVQIVPDDQDEGELDEDCDRPTLRASGLSATLDRRRVAVELWRTTSRMTRPMRVALKHACPMLATVSGVTSMSGLSSASFFSAKLMLLLVVVSLRFESGHWLRTRRAFPWLCCAAWRGRRVATRPKSRFPKGATAQQLAHQHCGMFLVELERTQSRS